MMEKSIFVPNQYSSAVNNRNTPPETPNGWIFLATSSVNAIVILYWPDGRVPMKSSDVMAHVLSARCGQYGGQGGEVAWIFGVEIDEAVDGRTRWIIETTDKDVIAQLEAAYTGKLDTAVRRDLLVDPAINAVD
jgi:hypothetical protein